MKRENLLRGSEEDFSGVAPATKSQRSGKLKRSPADPEVVGTSQEDELGRLTRLGFSTLAECFLSIPKSYIDFTRPIDTITPKLVAYVERTGKFKAYLVLRPIGVEMFDAVGSPTRRMASSVRTRINCRDARGNVVPVTIFGSAFAWQGLIDGLMTGSYDEGKLHLHGTLRVFKGSLGMDSPSLVPPLSRGKIVPVYAGKAGQVSGERLGAAIIRAAKLIRDAEIIMLAQAGLRESEFRQVVNAEALPMACPEINEPIDLLESLHFPQTVAEGLAASDVARRLAAEAVVRRAVAAKTRLPVPGSSVVITNDAINRLVAGLPYKLTGDQLQAIEEIVRDIRSPYAMNRLLSGDVGTGKSLAFQVPAVAALQAGSNVAILVPSQLLVAQMAAELKSLFKLSDMQVVQITGDQKPGAVSGPAIYVGSTALINFAKKRKLKFSFLVVDEQHKFSVEQKSALSDRNTNVLEATATAIPRSLALVHFGGMDVSILRQCPVVKDIRTRLAGDYQEEQVKGFLEKVVAAGGQVAVVYPLVVASAGAAEGDQTDSVIQAGEEWAARFPNLRVAVLHGKTKDKDAVISAMKDRQVDILISSLVIEVGVTLPSLKAIVVQNADRFGVAQLHQLRGRVARKGGRGYMFLMTPLLTQDGAAPDSEETLERLALVERCSDGFELAEADMDMRGFGDVADDSTMQAGNARALFHNAKISTADIEQSAKRIGLAL